jgi:hypothetical protein
MVGPIIRLEVLAKRYRGAEKTTTSVLTTVGTVLATPFGGPDGPVTRTRTDGHELKEGA